MPINLDEFDAPDTLSAETKPKKVKPPYVGKSLAGVQDDVADRFEAMSRDYQALTDEPLKLNSAVRTYEHQAEIYRTARPGYAAKPGHSSHEVGNALDIDETQAHELDALGLLTEHGFHRPLMGQTKSGVYEPWHVQPVNNFEKRASKIAATVAKIDLSVFDPPPKHNVDDFDPPASVVPQVQQPGSAEEASTMGFTGEGIADFLNIAPGMAGTMPQLQPPYERKINQEVNPEEHKRLLGTVAVSLPELKQKLSQLESERKSLENLGNSIKQSKQFLDNAPKVVNSQEELDVYKQAESAHNVNIQKYQDAFAKFQNTVDGYNALSALHKPGESSGFVGGTPYSPKDRAKIAQESGLKFAPDRKAAEPAPGTEKSILEQIPPGMLFKRAYDGQMVPFEKLHPIEQQELIPPGATVNDVLKGFARGVSSGLIQPPPGIMGESWGKGELRPVGGAAQKLGEQAGGLAQFGAALIPGLGIGEMGVEALAPLMVKTLAGRVAKSGIAGGVAGGMTEGLSQAAQGKDFTTENLQKIANAGANAAADLMLLHYGVELAIPWIGSKIALGRTVLEKAGQEVRDAYYRNLPDSIAKLYAKGGLPAIPAEYASDKAISEWLRALPGSERAKLIKSNQNVERVAKDMQRGGYQNRPPEVPPVEPTGPPGPEALPAPGMAGPQAVPEPPSPVQGPGVQPKNTFQTFILQTGGHQGDPAALATDLLETREPGWAFSPQGMKEISVDGAETKGFHKELALVFASQHPELAGQVRPNEIYQHLTPEDMEAMAQLPRGKMLLERLHTAATLRMGEAQQELGIQAAQEAAQAPPVQLPDVDTSRPAIGPLFTPEQLKGMTHEQEMALPPELRKKYNQEKKEYLGEQEKGKAEKGKGKIRKVSAKRPEPPVAPAPEATRTPAPAPKVEQAAAGGAGRGEVVATKKDLHTHYGVEENAPGVYWHGTPGGDLRGSKNGLHVGTFDAAQQALNARIGIPAEGEWDGTREYGKTLLAGKKRLKELDPKGHNQTGANDGKDIPDENYYPHETKGKYSDQSNVSLISKPDIFPIRITGEMTNTIQKPHGDFKANALMSGQIRKGTAQRGYYYEQVGEDAGSISAVVPNAKHIERILPAVSESPPPVQTREKKITEHEAAGAKEPWEMGKDEFVANPPEGYRYQQKLPAYAKEHVAWADTDGKIVVTDAFFGHDANTRAEIVAHEKAHLIEEKISPDVKAKLFDNEEIMAYRGRNINEKLANWITDGRALPAEVLQVHPELADSTPLSGDRIGTRMGRDNRIDSIETRIEPEPTKLKVQEGEAPPEAKPGGKGYAPKFLAPKDKGGIYDRLQEGFKTADDFFAGQKRNPSDPKVREGLKGVLESFKSWHRQEALRTGGDSHWESVNFSETLADDGNFQSLQKKASEHEAVLIPVKGLDTPGIHIPNAGEFSAIILVNENPYGYTYKQVVDHELFHSRIAKNDVSAQNLLEAIDRDSEIFKDFSESIKGIYSEMGHPVLSLDAVAEELAANYIAGIPLSMSDGKTVSLNRAFKDHSKVFGLRLKYKSTLPPRASPIGQQEKRLAKRGPPEMDPEAMKTSIKNAVTEEERSIRGGSPVEVLMRRSFPETFERGKKLVDDNLIDIRGLAAVWAKNPRALAPEESVALLYDRKRLQNEQSGLLDRIEAAMAVGDDGVVLENRQLLAKITDDINVNDEASRRTGYEQGLGLAIRRIMMAEDYSLERILQRAKTANPGKELSEAEQLKYADMVKELEAANKKLEAYEKDKAEGKVKKSVKDIENRIDRAIRQGEAQRKPKVEAMAKFKSLAAKFRDTLGQLNMLLGGNQVAILAEMARELVIAGITDAKMVVNTIFDELSPDITDLSKRDVEEALSGYGKVSKPSQDEIDTALREVRRQIRLFLSLEDALSGQMPLRTGLQRDPVSDEVRALTREVKQAMRDAGIDSTSSRTPEEQWKTSLDAAKTRLNNQIMDNKKRLADLKAGRPVLKKKGGLTYDQEAKDLKEENDILLKAIREIEGKPGMSDEQKLRMATEAVEKSIANWERRIKEGDLTPAKRGPSTPATPRLHGRRAYRDRLRKAYLQMVRDARPTIDPEVAALRRYKGYLLRRDAQLQEMLDTGNFEKSAKRVLNLDPEAQTLKANVEAKKQKIDEELFKRKREARTPYAKGLDWVFKYRRAVILSGMGTLAKLGAAATMRQISTPVEDFVGAAVRMIPYMKQVADLAPTEGGGVNVRAEAAGFVQWFKKQTWQESLDILKMKPTELELLHGKHRPHMPPTMLDWFGHMHQAFKNPIKRVIYYRTLQKRTEWAMDHGVDMTEPANIMAVGNAAYIEANRAIFMNDNFMSKWFLGQIRAGKNSKNAGFQTLAFLLHSLMPIIKVPTNFTGEVLSYTVGPAFAAYRYHSKGGAKGVRLLEEHVRKNPKNAFNLPKAFEGMSTEDADYIVRNLKKGGLGFLLFLLGMAGVADIGGYWIYGEKRKLADVKPGDIRLFGVNISHIVLHHPAIFGPLMLGATTIRVMKQIAEYNQAHPDKEQKSAAAEAFWTDALSIAKGIPFVDTPLRMAEASKTWPGMGKFARQTAESLVIPPDLRRIAKATDKAGEELIPRERETMGKYISGSVPGLRGKLSLDVNRMKRLPLDRFAEIVENAPDGTISRENAEILANSLDSKLKKHQWTLPPAEMSKYEGVLKKLDAMAK